MRRSQERLLRLRDRARPYREPRHAFLFPPYAADRTFRFGGHGRGSNALKDLSILSHPIGEQIHSRSPRHPWRPSEFISTPLDIADVDFLIPGSPTVIRRSERALHIELKILEELLNRNGVIWSAPDVVDATGSAIDMLERGVISVQQIVDEEHVTDLFAVPVDAEASLQVRRDSEPRDPSLVLDPKLSITVDTGLSKNDGANAVDAVVIPDVLVGGALRTAVRRVEIQRIRLVHPADSSRVRIAPIALDHVEMLQPTVDLVRRGKQNGRFAPRGTQRFQHIKRPQGIRFEVRARIRHRGRHGHLPGEMKDASGIVVLLEKGCHTIRVSNVEFHKAKAALGSKPREVA